MTRNLKYTPDATSSYPTVDDIDLDAIAEEAAGRGLTEAAYRHFVREAEANVYKYAATAVTGSVDERVAQAMQKADGHAVSVAVTKARSLATRFCATEAAAFARHVTLDGLHDAAVEAAAVAAEYALDQVNGKAPPALVIQAVRDAAKASAPAAAEAVYDLVVVAAVDEAAAGAVDRAVALVCEPMRPEPTSDEIGQALDDALDEAQVTDWSFMELEYLVDDRIESFLAGRALTKAPTPRSSSTTKAKRRTSSAKR